MPVMLRDSTTGPEPHTSTPKWAQSTMAFSLQLELPAVARVLFLGFGVFFFQNSKRTHKAVGEAALQNKSTLPQEPVYCLPIFCFCF